MEAALDLSASSTTSASEVRIKTELDAKPLPVVLNSNSPSSSSMNQHQAATSPSSSNQSPTSSTSMTTNPLFPLPFYRSFIPQPFMQPNQPQSTSAFNPLENPALALANALASHGFLSPASAPPYASFFNTQLGTQLGTSPVDQQGSPAGSGNAQTPPASANTNFFNAAGAVPSVDPPTFLPTSALALSTLHRRRRPATQRSQSQASEQSLASNQQVSADPSSPDSGDQQPPGKKSRAAGVPDDKKDELYWERRRKNNEAAKRSRDARRAKEEEIVMRAAFLEQENLKLKAQVAVLKNETAKLHFMLLNHVNSSN